MAEKYPGGPPPQEPPPPYTPPPSSYPSLPASYPPPPANYPPPPASYTSPPAGYTPPPGGHAPPPGGAAPGGYPHPPGQQTTIVVTSTGPPPKVQQAKPKRRGLFGSLMDGVESLGRQLEKEVDYCTKQINTTWAQYTTSHALTQFTTGSVLQLLSRSTGRCLQVVALPTGQLTVDGMGNLDPQHAWNTLWTVVNEGKNQVRLHNNHHYLALVQGVTQVIHLPPGAVHGIETKFQLCKSHDDFVMLESVQETGRYVAILPNGQLKPAVSAGRDMHSHFGIKVVYTPYVTTTSQVNVSTNNTAVKKH